MEIVVGQTDGPDLGVLVGRAALTGELTFSEAGPGRRVEPLRRSLRIGFRGRAVAVLPMMHTGLDLSRERTWNLRPSRLPLSALPHTVSAPRAATGSGEPEAPGLPWRAV